jgi:hypothetical protein
MEAGRSLGLLGSKACKLELPALAVRICELLAPLANEEDKGALLPSRHVRLIPPTCLPHLYRDERPSSSQPHVNTKRKALALDLSAGDGLTPLCV